jgi:hypothetical protein
MMTQINDEARITNHEGMPKKYKEKGATISAAELEKAVGDMTTSAVLAERYRWEWSVFPEI